LLKPDVQTTISGWSDGELSAVFESLLGSFQGDSLSGKLFTLVLAGALIELHQRLAETPPHIPNPPISKEGMPLEPAYSDDCNFRNVEKESLEAILPVAKEVFKSSSTSSSIQRKQNSPMFSLLQLEKPSLVVMTPCYVAMRIGGRVRSLDHCCVVKVT
jgi:hypothetical protein